MNKSNNNMKHVKKKATKVWTLKQQPWKLSQCTTTVEGS